MKDSRDLNDLHPLVKAMAQDLIAKCKAQGIDLIVTQTLRDTEYQNHLYAQGRTRAGNIITNSPGGSSYHNYGLAFDVLPLKNGKADWSSPHWQKIGAIGKTVGLTWGGGFTKLKDRPHFQYTFGLSIADLKAGKRPAKGQ